MLYLSIFEMKNTVSELEKRLNSVEDEGKALNIDICELNKKRDIVNWITVSTQQES